MNQKYSYYQLHAKIDAMAKFLNLDKYIEGDKNSLDQIRSYYRINHWAYRHYHSQDGFMHFRLSENGCFTDEDVFLQPDSIAEYIQDGNVVLELGSGQCSNLMYLARCFPQTQFYGVDLFPLKRKDLPLNIKLFEQDYSDLSRFEDQSVDVAYAIETIVHNSDKEKIFKEVRRVLKPNGVFIIYDYATCDDYESYDPHLQKVIALLSKGGASAMIESLQQMNTHFTNSGLTLEKYTDYSQQTLPDLKRLERKAAKILTRPWLSKLLFWALPDQFVTNIIIGYLGYDSCNAHICTYQEWVLRRVG